MKKAKRASKIIVTFLIALGIFVNLSDYTDTTLTEPSKIIIGTHGDDEPIDGKH